MFASEISYMRQVLQFISHVTLSFKVTVSTVQSWKVCQKQYKMSVVIAVSAAVFADVAEEAVTTSCLDQWFPTLCNPGSATPRILHY